MFKFIGAIPVALCNVLADVIGAVADDDCGELSCVINFFKGE